MSALPISYKELQKIKELMESCFERTEEEIQEDLENQECELARQSLMHRRQPKIKPDGFIYMMRNRRNGYIKIGFSIDPKHREATLQSEDPDIEMIWKTSGTLHDERRIHKRFQERDQRVRGEWFRLSEKDIESIKRKFSK